MKINAIRIKNLASLEGVTEIDFTIEPLASAGIFAITGATGAGKSTLLDALCLALYGKTPRYLQAKEMGIEIHDVQGSTMSQGDVRGILRDGTAEGSAEVDFIGTDGQEYRSTWNVRRARNKAEGSLQADTISLKNISSNLDIPGRKTEIYKEIERLVGLNFEQFTRSVLLAQGDFTAFMKANKDEKSSLLEKLTGTHIYSQISKKIFEKYRLEEQAERDLQLRREGIMTLSEEELVNFIEEQRLLEISLSQLSTESKSLSDEIDWHEQSYKLVQNKEAAGTALKLAEQNVFISEIRKKKLHQIDQAQKTRTWNDALQYNQFQLDEKKINLERLTKSVSKLLAEKELLDEKFKNDEIVLAKFIKIQKDSLPQLATAKKLDTIIFEKEQQVNSSKKEFELSKSRQENLQKQISEKAEEIQTLIIKISILSSWKTKHQDKKSIAENKDFIISKLTDAAKLLGTLETSVVEKNELEKSSVLISSQIKDQISTLGQLEKDWKIQQSAYNSKNHELVLIPIERLNLEKDETDISLAATLEAHSIWNVLYNMRLDFENLVQKQKFDKNEIVEKNKISADLKSILEHAKISKQISEQMLQKAQLAASDSVEAMREILVDDEPCPVCGSAEHPYAEHNPQLKNVLSALQDEHKHNENSYLSTFGKEKSLAQDCMILNQIIEKQEAEILTKNIVLESKNTLWQLNSISHECLDIADNLKSSWFDERLQNLRLKLTNYKIQIEDYSNRRVQLENLKSQLEKLKENKDKCSNELKDNKGQLAIFETKISSSVKEILQITNSLDEINQTLSIYFSSAEWMERWKENTEEFTSSILKFALEWLSKLEELEKFSSENLVETSTLNQMQSYAKSIDEDFVIKLNSYQKLESECKSLKEQRNAIFEGESAELIEEKIATNVIDSQAKFDGIKLDINQNKVDAATIVGHQTELIATVEKISKEVENSQKTITNWLQEYNLKFEESLNNEELEAILALSPEWVESERQNIQNVMEQKTKAESIMLERSGILQQHLSKRPSERSLEEIKSLYDTLKDQNQNNTESKSAIGFKIDQDKINKGKIGDLLEEISIQNKITDNWNKLNDIIGSSDGKKFRQIAQEYTLEVLLSYANIHLKVLTNRYRIERIPNTLALQVVDLDMGDEIRTVYSLSGGESFLVSLALALGLASLSSNKMKVESLFIDEGFGSLDPNTLNVAMDALERLHNQGRKVGVISHVQEMTERIPVQIKVSKKASGRSKVEIVGI